MIVKPDSVKRYVLIGRPSKVLDSDRQPVLKDGVEEWRYPVLAVSAESRARELLVKAPPPKEELDEGLPVTVVNPRAFVWINREGQQALSWRADAVTQERRAGTSAREESAK
ncbi:MAG: hypothetical protein ACRDL2_15905 [Gaiellaceae bacterium]